MNSFSQRKGIKPFKSIMQVDSMDNDLRNSLWNALTKFYWSEINPNYYGFYFLSDPKNKTIKMLCENLWHDYFKVPVDTISDKWGETLEVIRKYFFQCEWYEAYDFIEFVANSYSYINTNVRFMEFCNKILEKELSAYRFVDGRIAEITTQAEIAEIEQALEVPIGPVKEHLKQSLDLLADRKSPDYRNSIKEAISAVESLCKLITVDSKAELGDALKAIESKIKLHPALKNAFTKLYGYTSDADGIRHALMDESNVNFEDAKFMLVSCSAFINYLVVKLSKAGIKV